MTLTIPTTVTFPEGSVTTSSAYELLPFHLQAPIELTITSGGNHHPRTNLPRRIRQTPLPHPTSQVLASRHRRHLIHLLARGRCHRLNSIPRRPLRYLRIQLLLRLLRPLRRLRLHLLLRRRRHLLRFPVRILEAATAGQTSQRPRIVHQKHPEQFRERGKKSRIGWEQVGREEGLGCSPMVWPRSPPYRSDKNGRY